MEHLYIHLIIISYILVHIIQKKNHYNLKENLIYTFCFLFLSLVAAIAYPNIASVLSIIGGSCAITMCYTVPTYCYVQTCEVKYSINLSLNIKTFQYVNEITNKKVYKKL